MLLFIYKLYLHCLSSVRVNIQFFVLLHLSVGVNIFVDDLVKLLSSLHAFPKTVFTKTKFKLINEDHTECVLSKHF